MPALGPLSYTIPYRFDRKLWKIPLELITTVLSMVVTIPVLNLIRVEKKPHWLQHTYARWNRLTMVGDYRRTAFAATRHPVSL